MPVARAAKRVCCPKERRSYATAARLCYAVDRHVPPSTSKTHRGKADLFVHHVLFTVVSEHVHDALLASTYDNAQLYHLVVTHFDQHCPEPDPANWNQNNRLAGSLLLGKCMALQNVAIVMSDWAVDFGGHGELDYASVETTMLPHLCPLISDMNRAVALCQMSIDVTSTRNRCWVLTTQWLTSKSLRLAGMWYTRTKFHTHVCLMWLVMTTWQQLLGKLPWFTLPCDAAKCLSHYVGPNIVFVGRMRMVRRAVLSCSKSRILAVASRSNEVMWNTWYDVLSAPPVPTEQPATSSSGSGSDDDDEGQRLKAQLVRLVGP